MSGERELIVDLILIIAAATAGGVMASALRLPVVLGYLAAGVVVGHSIPGLELDVERVQDIAELGVALLLFTLGVRFSLRELRAVGPVAIGGGLIQIVLTIGLGMGVGYGLGFTLEASILVGAVIALSSTMVALKLLESRGEQDTVHGRVTVGILIVQDLAVGPLVILIPTVAGDTGASLAGDLGLAAGKALLLLAVAYVLGTRIVPWLLFRIAGVGSRELFLLAVLSLAFGLAAGSSVLGLGLAFGAFLAGLVVSESEYSHQTLADVLPLRDVFATIFFVSMGLLIDPAVLMDDPGTVAAIAAAIVVGKLALVSMSVALFRYPLGIAALAGLALAQAGEFSFVLTQAGLSEGIISEELSSTVLMAVLVSIVVSPFLLEGGSRALSSRFAQFIRQFIPGRPPIEVPPREALALRQHAIICGYGRVGRALADAMARRNFRFVVIEQNPYLIEQLRKRDIPHVYGDAANRTVLEAGGLERARLLAVTIPDLAAAKAILGYRKDANPRLDVIVRGADQAHHHALLEAGAAEVVHPEFEAGLEFISHTLHRFGVDSTRIRAALSRRRRDLYRPR